MPWVRSGGCLLVLRLCLGSAPAAVFGALGPLRRLVPWAPWVRSGGWFLGSAPAAVSWVRSGGWFLGSAPAAVSWCLGSAPAAGSLGPLKRLSLCVWGPFRRSLSMIFAEKNICRCEKFFFPYRGSFRGIGGCTNRCGGGKDCGCW